MCVYVCVCVSVSVSLCEAEKGGLVRTLKRGGRQCGGSSQSREARNSLSTMNLHFLISA